MFGNLFNQKNGSSDSQTTTQGTTAEVKVQQSASSDILGDGGTKVEETIKVSSAPQNVQEQAQANNLTSTPAARENLTALSRLDPRAAQVLHQGESLAKKNSQSEIWPGHLLYGLLYDSEIFKLLEGFGVDVAAISKEIESKQTKGNFSGQPTLNAPSKQILDEAYNTAKVRGSSFVSPEDILLSVFSAAATAEYLSGKGIQKEKIEEKLSKSGNYTVGTKSMIERYSIDLTDEARQGTLDPITGRDREIERLIHIMLRRSKNNPIIIGEAGVGKTAIVEGLAQKIIAGTVPADLSGRRVMQLDLASLIAGASHRGEFEERFRAVIKEAQASSGQIILFIDEIHSLIGAGDNEGTMDASNIIKPYLARGQIQLIGTTTTAEYRKYFEKDKAFERRFQPILVEEPAEEVAIEMLKALQGKYEKFHKVTYSPESIDAAVHLSKKYVGERFLPDKAVDLLDEAGAEVKLQAAEGKRPQEAPAQPGVNPQSHPGVNPPVTQSDSLSTVKKGDIEKVVSAWTGIPITKLTEDESQKLIHMEDLIHKRFVDQDEAVVAVSEAIRRGRIGLSAANRPIASFIFLGPTGVGKTELAKAMAEILFGKEESMIRLDMSEYMEKHEVAKLIGAPPGYVGYEEGGQLTEAVRAKPYSIVLLDEVEKAHPDVFNILLQLLEDGRLTDNKGNTISFKNTVIIATSNLGSQIIQKELSEGGANLPDEEFSKKFANLSKTLMEELHKFFRPELLNRFDGLVVFKPLAQKDMLSIAKLNIGKTRKLLKDQGFELQITDAALAQLAKEGYDPVYGARPLRRLIQSAIENPISLQIISKNFVAQDTIVINFDPAKNEYTFAKLQKPAEGAVGAVSAEIQVNGAAVATTPGQAIPQVGSANSPHGGPAVPNGTMQSVNGSAIPNEQSPIPTPLPSDPISTSVPLTPAPSGADGAQMQKSDLN